VDVHAHVGLHNKMPWLGTNDLGTVLDRAARVGVNICILSHLSGLYGKPANLKLLRQIEKREDAMMWWVVDPRSKDSLRKFKNIATHPKVVGMKIGPTYHKYRFAQQAQVLLELAGETNAAILTHSGEPNDMPSEIVKWANRYPAVRVVMAHFGNCQAFQGHLKAMRRCTSPNCVVDTSSAVSLVSDHIENGVQELGAARFLFGSDSPLYSVAAQCARILEADLSPKEKRAILGDNACRWLLRLPKK
jgi:predicted TIM-barrel fold metal-dependent hydrolase